MSDSAEPVGGSFARAQALLDILDSRRLVGYGSDLPGEFDANFRELAEIYEPADDSLRQRIRDAVQDSTRLLILGFSGRLATVAARTRDQDALRAALLAHSIEDFRHDPRENILRMAVVYHVGEMLKLNTAALFAEVAALSSTEAASELQAFAARPKGGRSLKAMRLRQIDTPAGVAFEPY